ncbi:hypothetical protein ACQKLP_20095 [Chitinophaga sp. NPDC101104]|uniref:hypothetical protein n=1 Tax=Chitinophaga sp. NPDC101104 TaxID=3390561 RepID=UPI003D043445
MSDLIKVSLTKNGEVVFCSKYIKLEPIAPSLARKFIFERSTSSFPVLEAGDLLTLTICFVTRLKQEVFYLGLEIYILEFGQSLNQKEFWLYGNICNCENMNYSQGEVDVFKSWQDGHEIKFNSLHVSSIQKLDYIGASLYYSGLSKEIIDSNEFLIDLSVVKVEIDLFYTIAYSLVGERGYFGHDFHTFRDCLLEVYIGSGFNKGISIKFKGRSCLTSSEVNLLLDDIAREFSKYGFNVLFI